MGKTESQDETTEDVEKRSGLGTIVRNKAGQQVLVCADGQRLLLDKLGLAADSLHNSTDNFVNHAKEFIDKTGEKGKAMFEKAKNSSWGEKLKNLSFLSKFAKKEDGQKVPELPNGADSGNGTVVAHSILTASKIKFDGEGTKKRSTKKSAAPKREMNFYMKTVLKEALGHGLVEAYYDSFMFEKVKGICDKLDAGTEAVNDE